MEVTTINIICRISKEHLQKIRFTKKTVSEIFAEELITDAKTNRDFPQTFEYCLRELGLLAQHDMGEYRLRIDDNMYPTAVEIIQGLKERYYQVSYQIICSALLLRYMHKITT